MTATKTRSTRGSSTSLPPTLGPDVCRWIERNCILGEGDFYGQAVQLRPFQKAIIYRLYELTSEGRRRYSRALIGFSKGAGKTPLAAWIASAELAGPVLCGGWRSGKPVGVRRPSPVVPVGAASFDQADLVFGEMKVIWRESPALRGLAEVFDTEILLVGEPGRAYRIAAARATNDGGRPSCFVADEFHEWTTPAQEGAHLVMANGTAKRAESLQLHVTTAGANLDSLLGRMYQHGKRVQAGELVDDGFLFVWHEAPEGCDVTDDVTLRAAIRAANPAADDYVDVEAVVSQFRNVPEFEGRRYFLNQWTRAAESWLPSGAWGACAGPETIPDKGDVFVGVDVALYHDSTAVVVAHPLGDGRVVVRSSVWEPSGGRIDVADVMEHIRSLANRFAVRRVVYDPRFFDVPAGMLADEGIPMLEVPQSPERMVPACGSAFELIVGGQVVHDGDPVLEDHVLSAQQRPGERGWTLSKGRSRRHIDACIAMVLALWETQQRDLIEAEADFYVI